MYQCAIASTYGVLEGGCCAVFETQIHMVPEDVLTACKNAAAEWVMKPENYGDGAGSWELPDYDWNYGDLWGVIECNEDLRTDLEQRYGVKLVQVIDFDKIYDHDEICIPMDGADRSLYGITI